MSHPALFGWFWAALLLAWSLAEALNMRDFCRRLDDDRRFREEYGRRLIEAWDRRSQSTDG